MKRSASFVLVLEASFRSQNLASFTVLTENQNRPKKILANVWLGDAVQYSYSGSIVLQDAYFFLRSVIQKSVIDKEEGLFLPQVVCRSHCKA